METENLTIRDRYDVRTETKAAAPEEERNPLLAGVTIPKTLLEAVRRRPELRQALAKALEEERARCGGE